MDIVINADLAAKPEGSTPIPHQENYYHTILTCLDYGGEDLPVADLLRRYHGLDGMWLIASPIHWQATHNDAMIVASGDALQLSEGESRLWFAALAEFMARDHIQLHYHDACTWLLRCDGQPPIASRAVHTLRHQSLMPEIQQLDTTLFWPRVITEAQMLFNAHPLNKARTESYSINGIWIWGDGRLHAPVQKPVVCQNDHLVKLATLLSTHTSTYSSFASLSKNSVSLFSELTHDEHSMLQTRLQKETVRWYWNNIAYLSKPKNWLSRLKERL